MQEQFESGLVYKGNGVFHAHCPIMAEECNKALEKDKLYLFVAPKLNTKKQRSKLINRSMHLWFEMMSKWLTDSGFSVFFVLAQLKKATLVWTKESFKELVWRNIQLALFNKFSTTELTNKEIGEVHDSVVMFFCERLGANPPEWPDRHTKSFMQQDDISEERPTRH